MGAAKDAGHKRLLLVWDMPNVRITAESQIRTRPRADDFVTVEEVAAWLNRRAHLRDLAPSATVFMTVHPGHVRSLTARAEALWEAGFSVHGRSVAAKGEDVDELIVDHVNAALRAGDVAEVIIASHDRRAFAPLLSQLVKRRVHAAILGHAESASWVEALPGVSFVDLRVVADFARQALRTTEAASAAPAMRVVGD